MYTFMWHFLQEHIPYQSWYPEARGLWHCSCAGEVGVAHIGSGCGSHGNVGVVHIMSGCGSHQKWVWLTGVAHMVVRVLLTLEVGVAYIGSGCGSRGNVGVAHIGSGCGSHWKVGEGVIHIGKWVWLTWECAH